MSIKRTIMAAGLSLLAASPPVAAADWNNGAGGLKDGGGSGGVPVPAPMPVPEVFNWYLRADVSYGFANTAKARETTLTLGHDRALAEGGEFGLNAPFFRHENDAGNWNWGGGIGYYFSPRIRGDLTVEARSESHYRTHGTYTYTMVDVLQQPVGDVTGVTEDRSSVRGALAMANLYWDLLPRGGRFTPYIGAGLGFAVHELERSHNTDEEICGACGPSRNFSGAEKQHTATLAAAAMAGVTYTIDPRFAIDLGYRYVFVDGFTSHMGIVNNTDAADKRHSTVKFSDQHEHQIRLGARMNVF